MGKQKLYSDLLLGLLLCGGSYAGAYAQTTAARRAVEPETPRKAAAVETAGTVRGVVDMEEEAVEESVPEKVIWRPETPEEIMFGVRVPEKSGMSEEVSELLDNKLVQILGRCGAGAAGKRDVFVVEPVVNVTDAKRTEGLVQNVNSISGELSLTARHRYSDAVIYNTTVPLNAVAKGGSVDAAELLTKAIKPTDAVFVRFVRNARKNAFEYGTLHPDIYDIPDAERDTVVVVVPVAVIGATPAGVPDSGVEPVGGGDPVKVVAPVADTPVKPGVVDCEIIFSDPGWKAEVITSEYDKSTRSIHYTVRITNTLRGNRNSVYTAITRALDINGGKYKSALISDMHNDFPYDIPVTVDCFIKDVYENPGKVPFIEMALGNQRMEIRNLPVK